MSPGRKFAIPSTILVPARLSARRISSTIVVVLHLRLSDGLASAAQPLGPPPFRHQVGLLCLEGCTQPFKAPFDFIVAAIPNLDNERREPRQVQRHERTQDVL